MNDRKKKNRKATARAADPDAEREARRYENPIPSRTYILQCLEERGEAMTHEDLNALLEMESEDEREALRRRLRAMTRDGQLIRNRRGEYAPVDKLDLVRGRVIGHPDGFGFLVPDEGGDDLFIGPREMRRLLHGDRALMHVAGVDRRGRKEGALVEVLERNTEQVVGRYFEESGAAFVEPENRRISQDVLIPPQFRGDAEPGQLVVAAIREQPTRRSRPIGEVIEVLGDHMAPGLEIEVAIRSYGLPHQWPEEVEQEITRFGDQVPESAKEDRVDLRDVPLVTIDGPDARDFDDAVYCEPTSKGWRLLVAIADVSHYVEPDSPLDQEARQRGNSVYFPQQVIPMLPEVLSNGLCSLNPDEDRLCMVCEMFVDEKGKVQRSRFFEGLMRSHARLIYDDVAAMLVDGDPKLREQYAGLLPHLEELHALYKVLRKARERRGAIDFETTETRIEFSEQRKIERIVPVQRNDAHMLIEECMILANVCAARFLLRKKIPALYRVHDQPDEDKLAELREFLGELGLTLRGGDDPEPKHYADVLKQAKGRPDEHLIQTVLLRSMQQAVYSPDNIGHFGLAHDAYAHFTSPIRRFPDLLVHRAIRHLLRGGEPREFRYNHEEMVSHGEHCSMTDRRADEATRDVESWLKCEYMTDKVGEEFHGVISGVTAFGIFVELADVYIEGLVHITALGNEYFHFDPVGHRLEGERTRTTFRIGDRTRVRVARVDLDERKIDLELLEHQGTVGKTRGSRKKAKTRTKAKTRSNPKANKHPGKRKAAAKKKGPVQQKKKARHPSAGKKKRSRRR